MELEQSVWSNGLLCGALPGEGASTSALLMLMLVLNVAMQAIFCFIVHEALSTQVITEDTVVQYRVWRRARAARRDAEAGAAGAQGPFRYSFPPSFRPPRARPASTSGGQFVLCVRAVISHIPRGKVAAYGQVAALAGAPRNARQVGRMLGEGLCYGGAPWHRVLGASGKVSLPAAAGGDTQRRLLREEGVIFRENGAVAPGTFWERVAPFFQ